MKGAFVVRTALAAGIVVAASTGGIALRQVSEGVGRAPVETASVAAAPVANITNGPPKPSVVGSPGFIAHRAVVTRPEVVVRQAPDVGAAELARFSPERHPGVPTTFLVTGEQLADEVGQAWFQVLLPRRPNNTRGWLPAEDVRIDGLSHRVDVHLDSYRLDLVTDAGVVRTVPIGRGTDATPTPVGMYAVTELLQPLRPGSVYGAFVLGLSGFSEVLTDWPGGGHLGLHGTDDPARTLGRRVSHGCIRVRDTDITELARLLPLGTPVHILDS